MSNGSTVWASMSPQLNESFPYSRTDICNLVAIGLPTLKNFMRGVRVLNKRQRGKATRPAFDLDDALRIALAKELLRVGVNVATISSLFDAIEQPIANRNKGWAWLRSPDSIIEGATLVLVLGPLHSPNRPHIGHVFLTTANDAVENWLKRAKQIVVVIDVGDIINRLETVTGQRYGATTTESEGPHGRRH